MHFKTSYHLAHSYRENDDKIDPILKPSIDPDLVGDFRVFDKKSVYQKNFGKPVRNHENQASYFKNDIHLNNVPRNFFYESSGDSWNIRRRYQTISSKEYPSNLEVAFKQTLYTLITFK